MIDLSKRQHIHIVGIGGAGMSAIATVLATMGHEVSGSDLRASRTLDRLAALGLQVDVGHDGAHVNGAGAVAISTAIPAHNPEVVAANEQGIPVLSRADLLSSIARLRRTIAVAGTHGKTTTSSMLALILVEAGMRPSFIIGGDVNDIGTNAVWDEGEWFVVEADESDGTFLRLGAEIAVVTSLEPDHIEHYGSVEELYGAFRRYVADAAIALCFSDNPLPRELLEHARPGSASFGLGEDARFRLSGVAGGRAEVAFELRDGDTHLGRFELPVPGEYNALNAGAAIAASVLAGARPGEARRALARFAGVARRFEFRGEKNGVTFVDDYAHLPGEVASVLAAAKGGGFSRIVAVFQPHRYSRTQTIGGQFGEAFVDADVVVVTSVYAAGEAVRPGVSGQMVVDSVRAAHDEIDIHYVPDHEGLLAFLRSTLHPGDLCITLEAGDLTGLPDELIADDGW